MVHFPNRRCHRCSVACNHIHTHRCYYTVALLPRIIHITNVKFAAAIIRLRVSSPAPDWVRRPGFCRQNRREDCNVTKPRVLN